VSFQGPIQALDGAYTDETKPKISAINPVYVNYEEGAVRVWLHCSFIQ